MELKNLFRDYIYPIAVFSGGMVGVGFLSLPYIAMKAGIWATIFYMVVITALVLLINLIFCDISLKTPDFKRFPGFVGHYLGKGAEIFTMVLGFIDTPPILLAYLLIGGQFLATSLQPFFHGSVFVYTLIYFVAVSAIVYFDIKIISKIEFWVLVLLMVSLVLIFIEGFTHIKLSNLFVSDWTLPRETGFRASNLFLPYGPLLFALWGTGLIPETEEMLGKKKKNLKKIIALSTLVVAAFYMLFILLILSITGKYTDETALAGLKKVLGDSFVLITLLVGMVASFTAFITQGIIFKKTLIFDCKIKHWQAFVLTCFTPLALLLVGMNSFVPILSFVGGVFLGIVGIMILLMYKKIGGKNIIIYPLSLVFLLGVVYELISFFKWF